MFYDAFNEAYNTRNTKWCIHYMITFSLVTSYRGPAHYRYAGQRDLGEARVSIRVLCGDRRSDCTELGGPVS